MRALRLLLLDDDPISSAYLAGWLCDHGHTVDAAATLAAATRMAASQRYDCLLVDRRLPDGDGLDWLGIQRPTPLPPVLLTGETIATRDLPAGIRYLHKPVDGHALLRMLEAPAGCTDSRLSSAPLAECNSAIHSRALDAVMACPADLDDATALRALGGNADAVLALRKMLRDQLESGRAWQAALGERSAERQSLLEAHRLRAGAAMTGCLCLAALCGDIESRLRAGDLPDAALRNTFAQAVERLLERLP